jgi:tRNA threonylcarbamoyladenosine biosynthesis protein TsaB
VKLIAVETSSWAFSVAACGGTQLLADLNTDGVARPSEILTDLIDSAARKAGFTLEGIDGFAISIGPGSFTGLRIGATVVKTLAWALKKPVLPVSSLEVIAQNLRGQSGEFCIFVDAHKKKVYSALFSSDGKGTVKRLSDDHLGPPEELLKKLKPGTLLVGNGTKKFHDVVSAAKMRVAPETEWVPLASALCGIAASRWPEGKLDDPHQLVPQYLYSKESDITGW